MIIQFSKDNNLTPLPSISYPDQFLKEKEKLGNENWIKPTMDYFSNIAFRQYTQKKKTISRNYDRVKGIVTPEDFYEETESPELKSFTEILTANHKLPSHVKSYSIMIPPINTLIGELIKRPDAHRIKAFDDDSRAEELEFKTNLLHQYIQDKIKQEITLQLSQGGEEPDPEQVDQMTIEKMKDYMTDYTSMVERWSNHILESCKAEFHMKEKGEDAFGDQLKSGQEYFHVYEDISPTGFNVEVKHPAHVWIMTTPNKKYAKQAYAGGIIEIMEMSDVIEQFPELTKAEIDHLRKHLDDAGILRGRETDHNLTGTDSIKYDTYNKAVLQERMLAESELEGKDFLTELFGYSTSTTTFGEKFVVIRAYFKSKQLIKEVTYLDEEGIEQVMLTDENYVKGSHPDEISVNEAWRTLWYQGAKIGPDIYLMKPFKLLSYIPIIGVDTGKCMVDMMKLFQTLYDVCMNQLFELLEKEIGVVYNVLLRKISVPKDGDAQDAIEVWEHEARARGVLFEDDSPENMKVPGNNTNNSRAIDLTRSAEIQSRYQLAVTLKQECWELAGLTRQRVGSVQATETATATNTAITQSYAQTEPYYAQHEYVMDDVYQAIVDAAQYIESNKPMSTVSYITPIGETAAIQMMGSELSGRDLKVFSVSRPQDQQMFNELRALAQPMLQNGASMYDVSLMYTTNSTRQLRQILKTLKETQEEFQQREQELKQQELEQKQQQYEAQIEQLREESATRTENENYNKAEDRINKKEVALIQTYSRQDNAFVDNDNNGIPDALELAKLSADQNSVRKDHEVKLAAIVQKEEQRKAEFALAQQKLQTERDKMKNDKEIAMMKIKADRAKQAAKPKPKAKKK